MVSGSVMGYEGQVSVFCHPNGPCYRCIFPEPAIRESVFSCRTQGILGPIPGVIGSIQAVEVLKCLAGLPLRRLLVGKLMTIDLFNLTARFVTLRSRSATCGCDDVIKERIIMEPIPVLIMGAAGRDFHNFNVRFREDKTRKVVAFTATQIPYINDRKYPASLAGPLYPEGIKIYDESKLVELMEEFKVKEVYFSYSDVPYQYLMNRAAIVEAHGADFILVSAQSVMIKSKKPVIAVTAVRTGCGKSQTTRHIGKLLLQRGLKVAAIRHPMPYGDLAAQRCQRFACIEDLHKHKCTIEEMEEYEPHIKDGILVYAGVDYKDIMESAEAEVDVILWDGGNNDWSFYKPDLTVVVVDPHRVGHERAYFPGEVNARMADVFVINKEDSASAENIDALVKSIKELSPKAEIVHADSKLIIQSGIDIKGKKVLCVEDGPTLTHGEMKYGAAVVAAKRAGAIIVDPRPWCKGSMQETFIKYPGIGELLPAMGYSDQQVKDLEETINRVECDVVVIGTPIDLGRLVKINKPAFRVEYDLEEKDPAKPLTARVNALIDKFFK
eukprot:TRINITY_DN1198_c0_g1_i2.p1 TRINITY_DN1198_c0_g1~~TRINITY_DN1198_c0_g1_i2.p1  ORF type:complete len:554 (-),score=141.02 TRINITY_DN1198_c0_g1_i2:257-1918(-)